MEQVLSDHKNYGSLVLLPAFTYIEA